MKPEERKCSNKQCQAAALILQRMVRGELSFAEAQRLMKETTAPGKRRISPQMLADARAHELRNTLPDDE